MYTRRIALTAVLVILAAWLVAEFAQTEAPQAGSALTGNAVHIEDPVAHPSPMGTDNAAVYLKIVNPTSEDDRLLSVESTVASTTELHETANDSGVLSMVPQPDGIPVPARSLMELKPGGKHILLIGLNQSLEAGQQFELLLHFQKAGTLSVTVPVTERSH
jgi:copper(I)-binding protein